jgi:hypothetical protein
MTKSVCRVQLGIYLSILIHKRHLPVVVCFGAFCACSYVCHELRLLGNPAVTVWCFAEACEGLPVLEFDNDALSAGC